MMNYQKGFTLVELSIVLVIIGLLIGGVLVGQSLIDSAKLNSEVRRLQQYSIAIVQFRQKFKQEAGDSNLVNCSDTGYCNNDGDNDDDPDFCPDSASRPESLRAWEHLSLTQMLKEQFVYDIHAHCLGSVKSLNGKNFAFAALTNQDVAPDGPIYYYYNKNGYSFGGISYLRAFTYNAGLDPKLAWGLDAKLDDGVMSASTGSVNMVVRSSSNPCTQANIDAAALGNKYCQGSIFFSKSIESSL